MMISSGMAVVDQVLREAKKGQEEDKQINRQQANTYFDEKISEMQSQVKILKEQASKMGGLGIFNFVTGIVTSLMNVAAAYVGGPLCQLTDKLKAGLTLGIQGLTSVMNDVKGLVNSHFDKSKANDEVKMKQKDVAIDTYAKFFTEYQQQEQEAGKAASETLQTLKQVRRDILDAQESMIKI